MIYSNRIAYRVDVTVEIMAELAGDPLFVAIKESLTTSVARPRWSTVSATATTCSPASTIWHSRRCRRRGRMGRRPCLRLPARDRGDLPVDEAGPRGGSARHLSLVRPLLDLDVSTYLVQNIKLAEVHAIGSNDRVRMPRQPLSGERREAVEKVIADAIAARPVLPQV